MLIIIVLLLLIDCRALCFRSTILIPGGIKASTGSAGTCKANDYLGMMGVGGPADGCWLARRNSRGWIPRFASVNQSGSFIPTLGQIPSFVNTLC